MKVICVIINFNGLPYLPNLIESLKNQTHKDLEIWVLDNNSFDESLGYLENVNGIKLFKFKKNYGIGPALNRVLDMTKGDYLFLLNMDLKLKSNCIEEMLKTFRNNKDVFCVDAHAIDEKGDLLHGIVKLKSQNIYKILLNGIRFSAEFPKKETEVKFACAAHMLMDLKKLKYLGGFNEQFFLEWEDFYICYKAREMKGWKTIFNPSGVVVHTVGGALKKVRITPIIKKRIAGIIDKRNFNYIRNCFYILLLFFPSQHIIATFVFFLLTFNIKQLIKGKIKMTINVFKAFFWILNHRKEILNERGTYIRKNR